MGPKSAMYNILSYHISHTSQLICLQEISRQNNIVKNMKKFVQYRTDTKYTRLIDTLDTSNISYITLNFLVTESLTL
jgi:hypothetical protein